ncbi:hypothetical protein B0J15DRAFT_132117 [Fusarium solani]|uniref:Uncharacterized protein n=1 Tax=Fusarium solani TaxID=169388 RepID=A0A9P9RDX1_FUSSL|nr:uncharacterized protein B0J15DRAFT_132117 [Fusarium solani]KAH7274510.1 hypothetical protein B0J15DRAFT_132117 [Fusarium solani]
MVTLASNPNSHTSLSPSSTRAVHAFRLGSLDTASSQTHVVGLPRRPLHVQLRGPRTRHRASSAPVHQIPPLVYQYGNTGSVETMQKAASKYDSSQPTKNMNSNIDPTAKSGIEPQHQSPSPRTSSSVQCSPSTFKPSPKPDPLLKEISNITNSTRRATPAPATPKQNASDPSFSDQPHNQFHAKLPLKKDIAQLPTGDATCEASTPRPLEINYQLIEAISRNIAQQLQMLSIKNEYQLEQHDSKRAGSPVTDDCDNESRTPSQREALDRFTQELHRYAEQSGAKNKLPVFTPTPPHSGATVHTVSALLPFRSEFTAASLAVTSKDQTGPFSSPTKRGRIRAVKTRPSRFHSKRLHPGQLDRNEGCQSSSTEISFTAAPDMDDWRHALVDQVPPRGQMSSPDEQVPKSPCVPCLPNDSSQWRD